MRKFTMLLSLTLSILLLFRTPVYAGNGNGKSVPELKSSTPADGDTKVSLTPEITLIFTNNITNQSVRDNNMNCIKLTDSNGENVDIEISLADDQVEPDQKEPDQKEQAVVIPKSTLKPDTKYTIVIAPELTSKNGVQAGKETTVSFTTQDGTSNVDTTEDAPKTENNTVVFIVALGVIAVIMLGLFIFKKKKK